MRDRLRLLFVLIAAVLVSRQVDAQAALVGSHDADGRCGAIWLYPQADGALRQQPARVKSCGSVSVAVTAAAWSSEGELSGGATLQLSARAATHALRLPLRLYIAPTEIAAYRSGRRLPLEQADGQRIVLSDGDTPNGTTEERFDPVRSHMWRLFVVADDTIRASVLPAGRQTAQRVLRLMWSQGGRPDSVLMPYRVQGRRPGVVIDTTPPELNLSVHLRGVRVIKNQRVFPRPFYDGIAVIGFRARASLLARQLLMDRLNGTVIAYRPRPRAEPDLIVRVGVVWRDSIVTEKHKLDLGGEVARFGLLLADTDRVSNATLHPPTADTTLVELHELEECQDLADREVRRRLASVSLVGASAEEIEQVATTFDGRWISHDGDSHELELTGTRDDVVRRLARITLLPQVSSARLNQVLPIPRPTCRWRR